MALTATTIMTITNTMITTMAMCTAQTAATLTRNRCVTP